MSDMEWIVLAMIAGPMLMVFVLDYARARVEEQNRRREELERDGLRRVGGWR